MNDIFKVMKKTTTNSMASKNNLKNKIKVEIIHCHENRTTRNDQGSTEKTEEDRTGHVLVLFLSFMS